MGSGADWAALMSGLGHQQGATLKLFQDANHPFDPPWWTIWWRSARTEVPFKRAVCRSTTRPGSHDLSSWCFADQSVMARVAADHLIGVRPTVRARMRVKGNITIGACARIGLDGTAGTGIRALPS